MPRFQIKRKTRKPEPEVVPEQKVDDTEVSLTSSDYDSDETMPLSEAMETLEMEEKAEPEPKQQSEPEYPPQRRPRPATIEQQYTTPARNRNIAQPRAPRRQRLYRPLSSIDYAKPSRSSNGRPHLQYKSHYGPNTEQLSTQDKARRLYNSCFG